MRVVVCQQLGGPEKLGFEEVASRAPEPGEVRIRVEAAGVNFVDALMIQGLYQIRPEPPFVPGSEIAGTVEEAGADSGFAQGDRVIASAPLGGYAEEVTVNSRSVQRMPEGMDFDRAAAFVQSYCTALHALSHRAALQAGETVLVLGASGGVGLACIDVARALGARVIAAASSADKLALAREQGADETIDYATEDLKTRAKELSGGGVDVVVDPVGGEYAEPALRALAPDGRFLVIGFAAGEIPRLPLNLILLKQCRVVGVNWGGWSATHREENAALLPELGRMFEAGKIRPLAPTRYSLDRAADALADVLARRLRGKAVLVP